MNPQMSSFDSTTPFMLLARIHVKSGCVDDYLELAKATDAAVPVSYTHLTLPTKA